MGGVIFKPSLLSNACKHGRMSCLTQLRQSLELATLLVLKLGV